MRDTPAENEKHKKTKKRKVKEHMEKQKRKLNGNEIKAIAMVTMLADHIGAILLEPLLASDRIAGNARNALWFLDFLLRSMGRVSFPLFAFMLMEGFNHTRNHKRHLARLALFAVLSEPAFDYAFHGTPWYPGAQSTMLTLLLGYAACLAVYRLEQHGKGKNGTLAALAFGTAHITVIVAAFLSATVLRVDYGTNGMLALLLMQAVYGHPMVQAALGSIAIIQPSAMGILPMLSVFLVARYDGTKGKRNTKWLFYAFYPLHLIVLKLIALCLIGS